MLDVEFEDSKWLLFIFSKELVCNLVVTILLELVSCCWTDVKLDEEELMGSLDEENPLIAVEDVEAEVEEEAATVVVAPDKNVGLFVDSLWKCVINCLILRCGNCDIAWWDSSVSGLLSVLCGNLSM